MYSLISYAFRFHCKNASFLLLLSLAVLFVVTSAKDDVNRKSLNGEVLGRFKRSSESDDVSDSGSDKSGSSDDSGSSDGDRSRRDVSDESDDVSSSDDVNDSESYEDSSQSSEE